jgi:hypothetical protein
MQLHHDSAQDTSSPLPPPPVPPQVLNYMKQQINGSGGVLVITLHQPGSEVSQLIDDLLLLGYGGSPVFMGPWGAAMHYFTGHLGEEVGCVCVGGGGGTSIGA